MPEFFNSFNWETFKKPNQSFRNVNYDPNAELNWDAHDWLSQRAENDRGPKYTEQDVEIFNSHIPEYKQIEQNSKSNGTWLQMSDGSRWVGDPREWVMMQSEAFKKNYQENPWYTGQAEWETQVTLPDGTVIDTDKVKRARYHNGEMWFSNDAGYAQYFADTVGREGLGVRGQFINNPNYKTDHNIKGTVFLAGIPKTGNYRKLEGPKTGYDHWRHMPFILTETGFERTNEKTNLLTDDLVSHSRKLGDDGLFLFNVNDGPVLRNKYKENKMVPYFARPGHMNNDPNSRLETVPINEFISQPGFTEKIKFIRGNNGNFDPNTDDKYSAIFKIDSPLFAKKGGRIHIKKKNRGKFTEYCGGKVTEECIAKGKKSKDPKIRKRATFAANARKWKHENGGILKAQDGTGNLLTPHPLSPVGIALNQAKAMAKGKTHLPPGVKEVVGPDGKRVAIRTEQPLIPLEQSIAEWLPGTGDVAEVGYIANDVKNGNYGSAALAAAMVALPGNVGKIFRKSDVPASKLTEAEKLGIPKGERNQPLNGHLKGDAAVQMFKEYGTQFPEDMIRLYRASGTSGNFKPSLDGTAKYSGMWFTDNPRKVNRYASSTFKTAKRNGVDNPIVLEYIDIPKSQLDQFRAKNIIKENDVEFELTEDFLIPVNHAGRKQVSWTGFTGNYLSDMRIPHPELPPISKNSKIYPQIQQLVPEARERYKLVGRTDIADDEIAGSLYKRAMELNGNSNAAIWETGEPRLLFRGDTRRYNRLMDKWSPEKLVKGKGTMDNSLGNLFLGDISGKGQGVDRYFISGTDFFEPRIQGSATGARGKFGTTFDGGGEGIQGTVIPYIPKDAYELSTYQTASGPYSLYKFPGKYSESGISDLNAFITRTPAMRDATGEISVLADDFIMKTKNYKGPNIDDYDGPTYDGVNSTVRDAMAKHYQSVLDDAQSKGQGLLFSEGLTDEYIKKFGEIHPFRREHERYDYYALPNFNRQNAKHLFGWDLRRPVQWDVDNIYLEKGGKL